MLALGCGKAPQSQRETVTLQEAQAMPVRPAASYLKEPPFVDADSELGRKLYTQCVVCHSLEADAPPQAGPGLHGVFGRKAASTSDFAFSEALRAADFHWTPAAMDAWLAQPLRFVPGSQMAYAGLFDASDRAALIAYLLDATDPASE